MNRRYSVVVLFVLFFLSGFAGLGYEMVWTRMLSFGLGHEIAAVLAVLASFFSGLALGAWLLDRPAAKSARPNCLYALLEWTVGVWAIALIWLIPWANRAILPMFGFGQSALVQWATAFGYTFVLLGPATIAMGGTLPVMETLVSALRQNSRSVAGLYAVNTLGAMAGTMITIFMLAPGFGFAATLGMLGGMNLLCGVGAIMIAVDRRQLQIITYPATPDKRQGGHLSALLFGTGLLGIGFEVMVVRLLSQILQNTVYSFAVILSVYLLGTAVGAAVYQRFFSRTGFEKTLQNLLILLSGVCFVSVFVLLESGGIYQQVFEGMGTGFAAAITAELTIAGTVILLPTILMGILFSHLAQHARTQRGGLGNALCINTVGGSMAPIVFGVFLLPMIGSKGCLLILGLGYLLLIPKSRWRSWPVATVPVCLAVCLAFVSFQGKFVTLQEGDQIVEHVEGVTATVTVVQHPNGNTVLKVNNQFQMGGTAACFSDRRQGHIPLLLHPKPKHALFLGLGTGATFAAAAEHPGLQADGVELLGEIEGVLSHFQKSTGGLQTNDSLNIVIGDARRYIHRSQKQYDVIIADLFHPARDGAGALYTREHFDAIRQRLTSGGLFCQWLPLYQMDLETLATVTRTFLEVFPDASAFMTHYNLDTPIVGLIGSNEAVQYPSDWFQQRVANEVLSENLKRVRLYNNFTLFGCYMADSEQLRAFAGTGPINTDDLPVVMYQAPHFTYSQQALPQTRLLKLVDMFQPRAEDIFADTQNNADFAGRLEKYWQGRDRFLRVGTQVNSDVSFQQMVAQVRGPLLEILKISPDFEAAYDPLVGMAMRLYRSDPAQTKQLLLELERINPSRSDVGGLRRQLFPQAEGGS